jgi:uncharacterized protein (TIGR02284 family)
MTNKEIADYLTKLIHLDYDAVLAYEQAIDSVEDPGIKRNFQQFKSDHERHISDVSSMIRSFGEEPAEPSRDIKGFFIEGFTAIRSTTGTDGALKAMETNEKLTNKKYKEAAEMEMPLHVKDLMQRNYEDEQVHLTFIEQQLHVRA